MARALPLFIRDYFKLDPAFFCSSDFLNETITGDWNIKTRVFQTCEEITENEGFDKMENEMNTEEEICI